MPRRGIYLPAGQLYAVKPEHEEAVAVRSTEIRDRVEDIRVAARLPLPTASQWGFAMLGFGLGTLGSLILALGTHADISKLALVLLAADRTQRRFREDEFERIARRIQEWDMRADRPG
jgi:hypothetical protein